MSRRLWTFRWRWTDASSEYLDKLDFKLKFLMIDIQDASL